MAPRDPPSPDRLLAEAALATGFLTRLPIGHHLRRMPRLADAVWAFPLAGLAAALPGALILALAPGPLGATLAVALIIWMTGALHEDGLADLADGLGARGTAQRLAAMRDSRIGSFGVLALGLVTALRITALAALPMAPAAFLAAAMLSRAIMGAMMRLPPARQDGLGAGAGQPHAARVATGLLLALAAAVLLVGPGHAVLMIGVAGLGAALIARKALHHLGGQTGDVLGASQQLAEAGALGALALWLA